MLVQYAVENYKSIKDEIIINFRTDKKRLDSEWVAGTYKDKSRLYKCIGLVGPNASGKTNIIDSLQFSLKFIQNTISRKETEKIHTETFALDEKCAKAPSRFEFIFYCNGIKYVYGFSVTRIEVIEEYLIGYFSIRPKTLFDRNEGQIYNFKGNDVKTQTELSRKTNKNRLYMPVAAEWGYQPAKEVYDWFNFVSRQYEVGEFDSLLEEVVENEFQKPLLLRELRKADFNISDIYIKNIKISEKERSMLEKFLTIFGDPKIFRTLEERSEIRIVHENSSGSKMDISLDEDSSGTSFFVQNISELVYLSTEGGLMIEDELGKTYHTKLMQHFLDMVKRSSVNSGNAQLLFSSHNTKVLNLLNPDQIYLVDKDEEGATRIELLDDYDLKEDEDIELGYLKGRYGSVPYMKG